MASLETWKELLGPSELPTRETDPVRAEGLRQLSAQRFAQANPFLSTFGATAVGSVGGGSASALGNVAGALGFDNVSDSLYQTGEGLRQAARPYMAPQLSYKTVKDVGSGVDFFKANVGQALASFAPTMVAARLGGLPAGATTAVLPQHGENVLRLKDDAALQGMSEGGILRSAGPASAVQGAMDYLVPGGVVQKAARAAFEKPLARAAATGLGGMLVEGGTEVGQELTGQTMHSMVNPNRDTSGDVEDLIQSGLGGALGAGPITGLQAGMQYAADKLGADVDGHLKGRTDVKTVEDLMKRDQGDIQKATEVAEHLMNSDAPSKMKTLAQDFIQYGKESGEAAELFLRKVGNSVVMDKSLESGRQFGKWVLKSLYGDRDARGKPRMANAMNFNNEETPDTDKLLAAIRDKQFVSDLSASLNKAFDQPAQELSEQADYDTGEASVLNGMREWISSGFGSKLKANETGEMIFPDDHLVQSIPGFADKLEFTYHAMKQAGQYVPSESALKEVLARAKQADQMMAGFDTPTSVNLEDEANPDLEVEGTNPIEPNEIGVEVKYRGKSEFKDVPFNVNRSRKADVLGAELEKLEAARLRIEAEGGRATVVGVVERMREQTSGKEAQRAAEDKLIKDYAKNWLPALEAAKGTKEGEAVRKQVLDNINKSIVYLRDQRVDRAEPSVVKGEDLIHVDAASKHNKYAAPLKRVEQVRDDKGNLVKEITHEMWGPEHGYVWFKKTDGTEFPVSTQTLIKLGRGSQNISEAQGVKEQHNAVLAGITSMMDAKGRDGSYTLDGSFGFKDSKDGQVKWSNELPDNLQLWDFNVGQLPAAKREKKSWTKRQLESEANYLEDLYESQSDKNKALIEDAIIELRELREKEDWGGLAKNLLGIKDDINKLLNWGRENEGVTNTATMHEDQHKGVPRSVREDTQNPYKPIRRNAAGGVAVYGDDTNPSSKRSGAVDKNVAKYERLVAEEKAKVSTHHKRVVELLQKGIPATMSAYNGARDQKLMTQRLKEVSKLNKKDTELKADQHDVVVARAKAVLERIVDKTGEGSFQTELDKSFSEKRVPRSDQRLKDELDGLLLEAQRRADRLSVNIAKTALADLQRGTDKGRSSAEANLNALKKRLSNAQDRFGNAKPLSENDQKDIAKYVKEMLGPKINVEFVKALKGMISGKEADFIGDWGDDLIRISSQLSFGQAFDVANHEAMHAFFDKLMSDKATKPLADILRRAANSAPVVRQLERLLDKHSNALRQINPKSEFYEAERIAYMFQFWQAGKLKVGPETKTWFQKIADFFRLAVGIISEDQQAEKIMQAFSEGRAAGEPSVVAKVLMEDVEGRGRILKDMWKSVKPARDAMAKLAFTAQGQLDRTENPVLKRLGRMFNVPVNEHGDQGMFEARAQMASKFLNKLENTLMKVDKGDLALALEYLQVEKGEKPNAPGARQVYDTVRDLLDEMHTYVLQAGVKRMEERGGKQVWVDIPKRPNYFPVVYDVEALYQNREEFIKEVVDKHGDYIQERMRELKYDRWNERERQEEYAQAVLNRLMGSYGVQELDESTASLGFSPLMTAVNERTLDWIDPEIRAKYQNKDLVGTMTSYVMQAVKRGEYVRRFDNGGQKIKAMMEEAQKYEQKKLMDGGMSEQKALEKSVEILTPSQNAVMALEGTLGYNIDPTLRELSGMMMVYQNFTKLVTSLFSSLIDPLGIIVNGGKASYAYDSFVRGVKEVALRWKGQKNQDEATQLAEMLGTVDSGTFMEALGQTYSSLYMYGKVKRWNDALFKINGMEAWNRAMRVGATQAAIDFIQRHAAGENQHSKRWIEDLYGEGGKPVMIDGKLDMQDKKNQMAIMRWVDGAILRPNAAQRTVWGSDPRFALIWHMKQFTYTFHKVILEKSWNEAVKYGNMDPMMTLLALYVPMMVAADAAKAILITGDEPDWMKQGLDSTISHGVMRANLLGIPQLPLEAWDKDYAQIAGPTVEWVKDWITEPADEMAVKSLPFGNVAVQWTH